MSGPTPPSPLPAPALAAVRARSVTDRFVTERVQTASPGALLVMLYDRLAVDLARAESAQREGDRFAAHEALLHAQEIVAELLATLDVDAWSGAAELSALYAFLLTELVAANTSRDPERTAACRAVVEPLRDTWREAAETARVDPATSTRAVG